MNDKDIERTVIDLKKAQNSAADNTWGQMGNTLLSAAEAFGNIFGGAGSAAASHIKQWAKSLGKTIFPNSSDVLSLLNKITQELSIKTGLKVSELQSKLATLIPSGKSSVLDEAIQKLRNQTAADFKKATVKDKAINDIIGNAKTAAYSIDSQPVGAKEKFKNELLQNTAEALADIDQKI